MTTSRAKLKAENSFVKLLAHPGVTEEAALRTRVGILAFHGGIEQGTTDIARAAAEIAGASYYLVEQPEELGLHVASHRIRRKDSAMLTAFIEHVDVTIALHGYGRPHLSRTLLLGGSNRDFAQTCAAMLMRELPHYEVRYDLEGIPKELRGLHPQNPVNLPRCGGVQIELPPRVRGLSPLWWRHHGSEPVPHQIALTRGLATALMAWTSS